MFKKVLILSIALTSVLTVIASASTLHTFTSDYDADRYAENQIDFEIPSSISQDWYPLKDSSKYLPIEVSWDNATREVVIDNFPTQKNFRNIKKQQRHKSYNLPESLKIKNGVTYCSPKFLRNLLGGEGFLYNNEVYCFVGEDVESKLINPGVSDIFKLNAITTMYEMKLKMPEEYEFNRKYLTGGIKCVQKGSDPKAPNHAVAYIYSGAVNPCCCIVDDKAQGATLASYISHEAYHVWQNRNGGVVEHDAKVHGEMVRDKLRSIN